MTTALEYRVDSAGHVSTDGVYREISEQDWRTLQPRPRTAKGRYDGAVDALAQGKIIALPAPAPKRAWTVARSIRLATQRRGLRVAIRRVMDPALPRGELVLVRCAED